MYLEKNLELLKKHHPAVYKAVADVKATVGTIAERNGCFDINTNGVWRYGGQFTTDWNQILEPMESDYPKMVVMYGVGLGNHVFQTFAHKNIPKSDHILIIERDASTFKKALEIRDWSAIFTDERVQMLVGSSQEDSYPYFLRYFQNYTRIFLIKTLSVLIEPYESEDGANYYLSMAEQIRKSVADANDMYLGSAEDSYRGFLNIIQNLPAFENATPFDMFKNAFKGKIGIAVSTGPSLKHSLEWLKSIQDKAVIMCSDSALSVLLNAGIEPHFAGCLERVPETQLLFEKLPEKINTSLVCCPVIWPETVQKYPGPIVNMIRPIGQLCWIFDDQESYFTGNSVSHLMYVALCEMGCDEVLIVGQDLAFDRFSKKTHVEGVADIINSVGQKQRFKKETDERFTCSMEKVTQAEGNDGTPIETMEWYVQFKYQLETLIAKYKKGINVIPKEYGAKIEGLALQDPSQVLANHNFDSGSTWKAIEKISSACRSKEIYKNIIKAKLDYSEEKLNFIQQTSLSVLDALSLFRQKHNPNYFDESFYESFLKKVEMIANNMVEDDPDFYNYFFYAQLLARSSWLQQFQGQVLAKKIPGPQRVDAKFTLSTEWFILMQQWAARMSHFIGSVKDELWPEVSEELSKDQSIGL